MKKVIISIILLFPCFAVAQQRQGQSQYQISRENTVITFAGKKEAVVARAFAYAPNIISKCSGSLAGGAQGQFAGISFAGSYKDEFCERVELIKLCIAMGQNELADELLLQFPMVKDLNKTEEKESCDYPTKCRRR